MRLLGAENKLGCACVSVGSEVGANVRAPNVASSVGRALESVLRFFEFATNPPPLATELGEAFVAAEAKAAGVELSMSRVDGGRVRNAVASMPKIQNHLNRSVGFLGRIFSGVPTFRTVSLKRAGVQQHMVSNSLSVSDFDLLRVVGKGAFGKVMLVRKKRGQVAHLHSIKPC